MKEAAANAAIPSENETKRGAQMKVGAEVFAAVFENLHKAEDEVNAFMANLCGMEPEVFAELEISVVMDLIGQLQGQKAFANFLKQASQ
jgi:hypothetical protein